MSAFKKIGVIVTVGAIITFAYYLLNKSKPKISEEQLADLDKDTVTPIEEQLVPTASIEEQLQIDKCRGLSRLECEQLIAKEDIERAKATGNQLVSTYRTEDGNAPRVNIFSSTRDGITYNSNTSSTGTNNNNVTITTTNPTQTTTTSSSSNPRVSGSIGRRR